MAKVNVGRKVLSANEVYAQKNRELLTQQGKRCFNMISSPGSGKTTLLVRTIRDVGDAIRIGVIEGDVQTDLDAQRIRATNAPAVQIITEGACLWFSLRMLAIWCVRPRSSWVKMGKLSCSRLQKATISLPSTPRSLPGRRCCS
jgi:hydrogenase accessory protein HypB